jgi:hypothetical protein
MYIVFGGLCVEKCMIFPSKGVALLASLTEHSKDKNFKEIYILWKVQNQNPNCCSGNQAKLI